MLDPLALTRRFIDIPSVTGEESAMAEASAALLRDIGFDVRFHLAAPDRPNVLATLDSPRVLLCSHLDTVPPYFPARDEGEYIYGRGACDTKGILAAMAAAAERLVRSGVRDLGLLWVVGEETDSIGAKRANTELELPDVQFTLVGEPTESKYAVAQKGGFKWTLRIEGAAAHSGYPDLGKSAIDELVRLVGIVNATAWGHDRVLGPGTANVGTVRGGLRANIVPANAEAEIFVRVVDDAAAVRARVESIVAGARLPVAWTEETSNDPQHLFTIPGAETTVVAFNTDVPHLSKFGRRLLMGPGSILDAHGPHERIRRQEVHDAVGAYEQAVRVLRAWEAPG